jgi:5-methylthioadenosine/S-adenosylhomocysteine deaminase
MYDLMISDAEVLALDSNYTILPHHDVAVQGSRIAAIGPAGSLGSAAKVISGRSQVLMPGLVNTHTHVGMAYYKGTAAAMELFKWLAWGWFYIQRMTPEDIHWATRLSCLEMIRAGVTTFCDQYFTVEQIAPAVVHSGLRACLSEAIMEPAPGMDARMPIEAQIEEGERVFKEWDGAAGGLIRVFLGPHSLYACSAPTIASVLDLAERTETRLHIHLSETRKEVEDALSAWGQTPPERMQALGMLDFPIVAAHCVHLSDSDIALLDRPTFGIAHNPASNLKLQSGRAPIEKLVGRALSVGLGSDGNGSNDIVDIIKDIYLTAILHPWTEEQRPAHTTLAMATREGARAIGLDAQIGSIEVGKLADLILVDLDNPRTLPRHDPHYALAFTARGDDVRTTIVNGQVLMEDRQVLSMNEDDILKEAVQRSERIFSVPFVPAIQ